MRRSITLCAAFAVALALLLVSGDNPHSVRGQTPPSTPSAGAVPDTPDLETVRQNLIGFFAGMSQAVGQARQSPQARAAIAAGQGDPTSIFTEAQRAMASATPEQLAGLQKVLIAAPGLLQLPSQLQASIGQLPSAAGASAPAASASGAAPRISKPTGGVASRTVPAPTQTSTAISSLMGSDCSGTGAGTVASLVSAVTAGAPTAVSDNNWDARQVFIAVWGFQQGVSALNAAYSVAASLANGIILTDKVNLISAALAVASGILNVFNLLAQQTMQAVLDCVTFNANSWLYTQDSTGVYKQLALEADLKKLTAAAEVAGLTGGVCNAYQALPASFTVQLGDPSAATPNDSNSAPGLLDDIKDVVDNTLVAMMGAGVNVNDGARAAAGAGDQAFAASQWQIACQDYAQAYVQLEQ